MGKQDSQGRSLLPDSGALSSALIAETLDRLWPEIFHTDQGKNYLAKVKEQRKIANQSLVSSKRMPYFCSGCPHNRSTQVPQGSRAMVGIGCHYIAQWMDRNTQLVTHMGGEGVPWIGQAPFTKESHIFVNLGDGTYHHSGILAIRQAVAAKVNVTYKVLFNDAVAMTGGQTVDGPLTVPMIVSQLQAEGVARIDVVSEHPQHYPAAFDGYPSARVWPRDALDRIQKALRQQPGVSVLIYDQTCASKKRKLRKRGKLTQPAQHLFINDLVCEGCGDCSVQSNCLSVEPLQTEFGEKRKINPYSCNTDMTCLEGFCPSFATIKGASLRTMTPAQSLDALAPPPQPSYDAIPANILITGIGGTGVTTVSNILGMAAHLAGIAVAVLDQSGLAQKGGAVTSHIRIAEPDDSLHGGRIPAASTSLLLAADLVSACAETTRQYLDQSQTVAVINHNVLPTGDVVLGRDVSETTTDLQKYLARQVADLYRFDALKLAEQLLGDQLYSNVIVLGYGYQLGLIPLPLDALQQAFTLNGQAAEQNLRALKVGRIAASQPELLHDLLQPTLTPDQSLSHNLDERIERRVEYLTAYQNERYADAYISEVAKARAADIRLHDKPGELTEAVARSLFKLMAYKDEYEVARLYTDPTYQAKLKRQFSGRLRISLHLAAPLLTGRDPHTGRPRKREYGPWIFPLLKLLAKLKFLRATPMDIFGYSHERREERAECMMYKLVLDELLETLNHGNYALAVKINQLPEQIRGFGPIKTANLETVRRERERLLKQFHSVPKTLRRSLPEMV